ncbi:hypothetical protein [Bradyrhizobium pachyrhizi]|uniref:hypothetical protein n=1 Tax=Bradyrhizobium pachyrhizi TaxID=280333 RepID=UPI003D36807E
MATEASDVSLDLTKEVLREVSPKELILADQFDPKQAAKGSTAKGPLGFGVESAVPLLLPIVYLFFDGVLKRVKSKVEKLGEETADAVVKKISDALKGSSDAEKIDVDLIEKYLADHGIKKTQAGTAAKSIAKVLSKHAKTLHK